MKNRYLTIGVVVLSLVVLAGAGVVLAGHNGAVVSNETLSCGETIFTASVADPDGTHKVSNMYLVVSADGTTQYENIPIDGSDVTITVGPFSKDTLIQWRVFGGGERSYDDPLWNGFGDASFSSDIGDYADEVGSFAWVVAGPEDPNPFTTWYELSVEGCSPAPVITGPYDAITSQGKNGAFEQSGLGSIENSNNPALRFGKGGRIAIPGEGGQHADEDSAVAPYNKRGSQSIVDPQGSF